MNEELPILTIKSFLSGKDAIKKTKKGVRYRFFHIKRRNKNVFTKTGTVFFFSDFGTKANLIKIKYQFNPTNKTYSNKKDVTWFSIKNNRLVISKMHGTEYRNISNCPNKICFSIAGGDHRKKYNSKFASDEESSILSSIEIGNKVTINVSKSTEFAPAKRFQKILVAWLKRNKIQVSKKQKELNINQFLLSICYPEWNYFTDICDKLKNNHDIPSAISSRLNGIKGINHAFDVLVGSHGKKIKNIILTNNVIENLCIAVLLKNLITVDDLQKIFEYHFVSKSILFRFTNKNIYKIRAFLKNFSRQTILKWILSDEIGYHSFEDVGNDYYDIKKQNNQPVILINSTDFDEIEQDIIRQKRRIVYKPMIFDYAEKNKKYSNFEFSIGNFTCELPKNSDELIDASIVLSNCLSSYTSLHGNNTVILFIKNNNVIKYAIAIDTRNNLLQFYGKYNKIPEKHDYELISNKLKELNVNTSSFDTRVLRNNIINNAVNIF